MEGGTVPVVLVAWLFTSIYVPVVVVVSYFPEYYRYLMKCSDKQCYTYSYTYRNWLLSNFNRFNHVRSIPVLQVTLLPHVKYEPEFDLMYYLVPGYQMLCTSTVLYLVYLHNYRYRYPGTWYHYSEYSYMHLHSCYHRLFDGWVRITRANTQTNGLQDILNYNVFVYGMSMPAF